MPHGYGKTALITGASSGIGRELAGVFAEHGYNLVVVARSTDALQTLAVEARRADDGDVLATVVEHACRALGMRSAFVAEPADPTGQPGRIVGTAMAGYDGHRGWLYSIAVHPACRRAGLGAALVQTAEAALTRAGCLKINLQLLATNTATAAFYEALGYAVEPRVSMGKVLRANLPVAAFATLVSNPLTFAPIVLLAYQTGAALIGETASPETLQVLDGVEPSPPLASEDWVDTLQAIGKPLMLVNADAALLLSNRALRPVADRVAFGFDGAAAATTRQAVVTGNPVRAEIEALPEPAQRWAGREGPLRLLVVGGSLGAQVLNLTLPAALALLPAARRPRVVHQAGSVQAAAVGAAYADAGIAAEVLPFIDDMPRRLAECDLMVCRAGAITVSELCAAGVPAILVPLIVSTTSHQRDNAEWMARHGAALHLPQAELTPERLAAELRTLTRERLLEMATRARALARPKAAARVADELESLVKSTPGGRR